MYRSRSVICLFAVFSTFSAFAQTNVWQMDTAATIGNRLSAALTYVDTLDGFLMNLGSYQQNSVNRYTEQFYDHQSMSWINYLPDDSLYGVWADSAGVVLQPNLFDDNYFDITEVEGHLVPQLLHSRQPSAYRQYAYNPDDHKIYFYVKNITCSYDVLQREWELYETEFNPTDYQEEGGYLKWGSMCYDPVNQEILLFGGGSINAENGRPGTWTFSPVTKLWTQLNPLLQPGARANSNMVYDPTQQKILLFGGDHLDFLYADTWVYDCITKTWEEKSPQFSPSPRGGHSMLYLPSSQTVVLMGGYDYISSGAYLGEMYKDVTTFDIWKYDWVAESWTLVKAFDDPNDIFPKPVASQPKYLVAATDQNDKVVVLADGISGWAYVPLTYTIELDASTSDLVGTSIYGVPPGTIVQRTGDSYDPAYYDGTLNFDTSFYDNLPLDTWVKVPVPDNKYPENNRDWGTSVYDPDRDIIYKWSGGHSAHCGSDVPLFDLQTAEWELPFFADFPLEYIYAGTSNPGGVSFSNRPFMPGHTYNCYDYDVNLEKMVMVSRGYTYTFNTVLGDWDSTRIKNIAGINTYARFQQMESTPWGVCLWAAMGVGELYLFSTAQMQWTPLTISGPNLPNSYSDNSGMVYDSQRDRLIISKFTGWGQAPILMAYNFSDNTSEILSPANETLAYDSEHFRESVYIPSLDIVFYQIEQNGQHLIYDCSANAWSQIVIAKDADVGTTNSRSSGYMYDIQRNIIFDSETNCEVYALRLSGSFGGNVSIAEETMDNSISVYPNPTGAFFIIDIDRGILKDAIIYNHMGQTIMITTSNRVDISNLPKGAYLMVVTLVSGEKVTKEILKN